MCTGTSQCNHNMNFHLFAMKEHAYLNKYVFIWYATKWVQLNSSSNWSIVAIQNIKHEFEHLIFC
jgi:hypothetical protein